MIEFDNYGCVDGDVTLFGKCGLGRLYKRVERF